ncbi:MAG: prenyltransferase/squalene oxidase repeat-containing protein [Pirellulaceae bacterium]
MSSYLQNLTIRLAEGLGKIDEPLRNRHRDYLFGQQQDDGGFRGRMGESDLYYTAFGLRGLSILGELYGEPAERAARFLKQEVGKRQTIVDFFSLFYAANLLSVSAGIDVLDESDTEWRDRVHQFLSTLRRNDGGFSKAAEGVAGSTYHTFLILLVYELMQRAIPDPAGVVSFLDSQFDADGGWKEIRASKRPGTNPTAAAVATLTILNQLKQEQSEPTIDFLLDMQNDEGGLRANTRIPIADLLSSFTGALSLCDLNAGHELDWDAYERYVNSLQLETGGFQAAVWDESHDVEYTFYGLGCLALIANQKR